MIAPKALKLLQQFNIIKKFVISFKDDKKQVNVKEIMLVVQELLQKQKIYEVQIRHKISKDVRSQHQITLDNLFELSLIK